MSKQTAVEWFWNQMPEILPFRIDTATAVKLHEAMQQAKAMEREQIIDAFGVGCQVESTRLIGYQDMASEYYNETYKGGRP